MHGCFDEKVASPEAWGPMVERGLGDRGRNVVTREFNEHFFQLKSLHSVHYEAAEAAAEAAEAATAACFNGKSPPLGPP